MKEIHEQCLICSSSRLVQVSSFRKHHLVQCQECNFVFAQRIPSAQELNDYYSDYPVKSHRSEVTIKRYRELLDRFERYRQSNNILDVGCGTGYFLDEARARGWNVFGTEYSPESISACRERGISMQEGQLNTEHYEDGQFDVVTSFEVIEHINDPREEIERIRKILRPDGLLYITTPNYNSLSKNMIGANWNIVNYPEHLSYYTPATMNRLMNDMGFRKEWSSTTGLSISRYKSSKHLDEQENIDPQNDDERMRERMERNSFLRLIKRVANFFLNALGKGDSLKAGYIRS